MNLLHEVADRRLVDLTGETHRLAQARIADARTTVLENGEPLAKIILAAAEDRVRLDCPYTADRSKQIAEEIGRPPRAGCIYVDAHRVLQAGTGEGANLVGVTVPGTFGEVGLDPDLADRLGVQRVPLKYDATFVRMATGFTTSWLSNETTNAPGSTPTLEAVDATPKRVGGFSEMSAQWLRQTSPAASAFVIRQKVNQLRHTIVTALFSGSGSSGEPLGIIGTTGVGNQSGTTLAWAGVIEMMRLVEAAGPLNPASAAWVVGTSTAKLLRTREVAAGAGLILNGGQIGSYRAFVSTALAADALIFGDFSQVVLGQWGSIYELGANPYQAIGFRAGIIQMAVFAAVDVIVLRPASFAKAESVT